MARKFDPVVQKIRERSDIVQIIGRYVKLQRAGNSYKACCPFHQEKTPSFHVHPDKQFYYCFGCGAKGDAFTFLMSFEGKTFIEAVEALAQEYGIEIPVWTEDDVTRVSEDAQKKEKAYQLNQWAREFFVERLMSEEGREVRQYLERRGISEDMTALFGLGYAPDDWGRLAAHFRDKQADLELACEIGLLKLVEGSDRMYDRYRHRLMFPILEPSGRLAGFGGRVLREDDGAKYLNSPDSLIFHKSKLLYGMNLARQAIRKAEQAIVVEGYLDVVCMHQYGFSQTVAALGTAWNEDHLRVLKRYTKRTILLFDGDQAGTKAAGRTLQILIPGGISVDVGTLADGEDPDSFLRRYGRQSMERLLAEAQPGLDYWISRLKTEAGEDPVALRDVTTQVLELLQGISDPILQNFYIQHTAERLGLEEAQLRRGFFRIVQHPKAATQRPVEAGSPVGGLDNNINIEHRTVAKLIKIVIENPDLFSYVSQAEVISKLPSASLSQLWQQLIRDLQEGADASFLMEMVLSGLETEPALKRLLAQVLLQDPPFAVQDVEAEWESLMFSLQRLEVEHELQRLQREIKQAEREGEHNRLASLSAHKAALQRRRQELLSSRRGVSVFPTTGSDLSSHPKTPLVGG